MASGTFKRALKYLFNRAGFDVHRIKSKSLYGTQLQDEKLHNHILIYQMGKVASVSTYQSLLLKDFKSLHVHHISNYAFRELLSIVEGNKGISLYFMNFILQSCYENRLYYYLLRNEIDNSPFSIITMTREPVSFLVSNYFHHIDKFVPVIKNQYGAVTLDTIKCHFRKCLEIYLDLNFHSCGNACGSFEDKPDNARFAEDDFFLFLARFPLLWFDAELKDQFGFDVYEEPFNKSSGFMTYKKNDLKILLIRFENFTDIAEDQIGIFIGDKSFRIRSKNMGSKKKYAKLYSEFCESFRFPDRFLNLQYSTKYAQYFYSNEELQQFASKWSGG